MHGPVNILLIVPILSDIRESTYSVLLSNEVKENYKGLVFS